MAFNDRLDFRILTMVVETLNRCAPPYISDMFSMMSIEKRMTSRSCARKYIMHIPAVRLNSTNQTKTTIPGSLFI